MSELLPIPYFHHVFTLPHILNTLALYNKAIIYDLFFKACGYTLNSFSKDPKYLNAKIGIIGILHTWGQTLWYHVHIHFIITGGGLAFDGSQFKRLPYQEQFLFPSRALSMTIRAKFVELLKQAYQAGKLFFPAALADIKDAEGFRRFCNEVGRQAWYNYTKPPFSGAATVVKYIGRYTHRVAISNHRLLDIADDQVKFSYKDYKDDSKVKSMSLSSDNFIRRFLWHILPSGFKRIRYYGFLAGGSRKQQLALARSLLSALNEASIECLSGVKEWLERFGTFLDRRCPKCKSGKLVYQLIPVWDSS